MRRTITPKPGERLRAHVYFCNVPAEGNPWVSCRSRMDGFGVVRGLVLWVRAAELRHAASCDSEPDYQTVAAALAKPGLEDWERESLETRTLVARVTCTRWRTKSGHKPVPRQQGGWDEPGFVKVGSIEAKVTE